MNVSAKLIPALRREERLSIFFLAVVLAIVFGANTTQKQNFTI
jgi:hypothetical protein